MAAAWKRATQPRWYSRGNPAEVEDIRREIRAHLEDLIEEYCAEGMSRPEGAAAHGGLRRALGALICGATRSWAGMPIVVSAFWAAAGATATVLAGTLTSVAPAVVGARVQPVEALRCE